MVSSVVPSGRISEHFLKSLDNIYIPGLCDSEVGGGVKKSEAQVCGYAHVCMYFNTSVCVHACV